MLNYLSLFLVIALRDSVAVPTEFKRFSERQTTGLHAAFAARGKQFWGSAADANTLNIPETAAILLSDFGQVTPENSMKWDAIAPTSDSFNFANADILVDWAVANGKLIRGHTLVWHSQLPEWVASISDEVTLTSVIQNHISNVAGRYKGKLYAWDVINEMFNEDGSHRSSVFFDVLGLDFVRISFQAARTADPTAKLYINDFNLDSANSKTLAVRDLVQTANANYPGLIDGIGTQVHLSAGGAGGVQSALSALAEAGTEVAITELDIAGASPDDYNAVVSACLDTSACVSITSWGVSDANSWRSSTSPLLWDTNHTPKPAYLSIIGLL